MKKTFFVILILIIFSSFSCSVKCPCMNEEDLTWFPYNDGDILTYINQQFDTLTLEIVSIALSDEYKDKHRYRDECSTSANIVAQNNNQSSINIDIMNYNSPSMKCFALALYINEEKPNTKGSLGINNVYESIESKTLNNVYYDEVVMCEKDTLQFDDDIWKTYIAKGYGIVQFHDRTTGYVWNLVHE